MDVELAAVTLIAVFLFAKDPADLPILVKVGEGGSRLATAASLSALETKDM